MKISLYFNNFNLGTLCEYEDKYLWTPNVSEIKNAIQFDADGMDYFFLPTITTLFTNIPQHYKEFLVQADRPDLATKANILEYDTDFQKLYKLSKLDFFTKEFVIKS